VPSTSARRTRAPCRACTTALHLALRALGLSGDEVITVSHSSSPPAKCHHGTAGARRWFVDIEARDAQHRTPPPSTGINGDAARFCA